MKTKFYLEKRPLREERKGETVITGWTYQYEIVTENAAFFTSWKSCKTEEEVDAKCEAMRKLLAAYDGELHTKPEPPPRKAPDMSKVKEPAKRKRSTRKRRAPAKKKGKKDDRQRKL